MKESGTIFEFNSSQKNPEKEKQSPWVQAFGF